MKLRVLIAEDDVELRKWLRLIFRPLADVEVTEARDGGELESLLSDQFDVVITDIRMPQRSGLEVATAARGRGLKVPIIFLTGYGDAAVEEAVGKLDQAVLLRKPVDNIDLMDHVRRLLPPEKAALADPKRYTGKAQGGPVTR